MPPHCFCPSRPEQGQRSETEQLRGDLAEAAACGQV